MMELIILSALIEFGRIQKSNDKQCRSSAESIDTTVLSQKNVWSLYQRLPFVILLFDLFFLQEHPKTIGVCLSDRSFKKPSSTSFCLSMPCSECWSMLTWHAITISAHRNIRDVVKHAVNRTQLPSAELDKCWYQIFRVRKFMSFQHWVICIVERTSYGHVQPPT